MKKLHYITATLALASAGLLSAQTTDTAPTGPRHGGHRGPGGRGGHPVIRILDADKNGEISATELTNAPVALKALDTNNDGTVSASELRPARPAADATTSTTKRTPPAGAPARPTGSRPADATLPTGEHTRPIDPVMLALDADKDGALSAGEITRSTASLKALDANSDGKLTGDELRPLPPAKN
jgi:hypothetical protein